MPFLLLKVFGGGWVGGVGGEKVILIVSSRPLSLESLVISQGQGPCARQKCLGHCVKLDILVFVSLCEELKNLTQEQTNSTNFELFSYNPKVS